MKAELLLDAPRSRARAGGAFPRLWRFATEYLLALPLGAAVALIWANADTESYFRFVYATSFIVNDVAMVFFFALITKEVVEASAPGGVLHPWRRAAMPVVAALGPTIVALLAFSVLVRVLDEPMVGRGWTTVLAVDLAVGYFAARIIYGPHAAVPFFLLLAISANLLGFLALAAADPIHEVHPGIVLPLMAVALATAYVLRRTNIRSFWPYVIVAGGLSWCALYFGGFHPALALLPIVPFLPRAARDPGFFVDAPARAADPLNRLELWVRHPAQAALFAFALVNAGVPFRALETGVWALPLATLLGKPIGLLLGAAAGTALGLHLPRGVHWRDLVVLGFISATGFTMALFFATATIGAGPVLAEIKMGALLGIGGCVIAIAAARLLRTGRFARR